LDELDAILTTEPSEALAKWYEKQADGKFLLRVKSVDGFALENVTGLKATLSDRMERHKKAQKRLEQFGDVTPEQVRDLKAAVDSYKAGGVTDKAAIEAAVKQVQEKYDTERQTWTERESKLKRQVRHWMLEAKADEAISKMAKDARAATILRPHVLAQLDMAEENGELSPVVRGSDGNPRLSLKTDNNGPMSIDELVEQMAKDPTYEMVFKGNESAGSGSDGGAGGAGKNGFSISMQDAHDPVKYRAAKERAAKAGSQLTITD